MFLATGFLSAVPFVEVFAENDDKTATIKGRVVFQQDWLESWTGQKLSIPFANISTKLYQQVELPPPPLPDNWAELNPQQQQTWWNEFEKSDDGKAFFDQRQAVIDSAKDFDVILESDGKFVIYDVPVGIYGLRGLLDKEIDGVVFRYEVFGQLEVSVEMDELLLNPIEVAITPLLTSGLQAPPINVTTHDDSESITLEAFRGKFLLVCFWISNSPSAEYQLELQKIYTNLKDTFPLRLLSICVDDQRRDGLKFIIDQQLVNGSHGFTDGFDHRTLFDYGVRAIPSFWLIDPEGNISLSQIEFSQAFYAGNDLSTILTHQLEGKPIPNMPSENQDGDSGDPEGT